MKDEIVAKGCDVEKSLYDYIEIRICLDVVQSHVAWLVNLLGEGETRLSASIQGL